MMRNFKGLTVCSCLAFALFYGDCFGMERQRSGSMPSLISSELIVSKNVRKRSTSVPVTDEEKAQIIRKDFRQFLVMTKEQANSIKSVSFEGLEINGEFVDKFWELFSDGVNELSFESCSTTNGYSFSDLFDGDYSVRKLTIKSNDLTMDDVDSIFSLVYPYLIHQFIFSSKQLDATIVKSTLTKRLGSCSPKLEILSNNS